MQVPEFRNLSLISFVQGLTNQFSSPYLCSNLLASLTPLDFPSDFPLSSPVFRSPSFLNHHLLCLPFARRLLAVAIACSVVSLKKTAALETSLSLLDDAFPLPDKRELTASTSVGSECHMFPEAPIIFRWRIFLGAQSPNKIVPRIWTRKDHAHENHTFG